MGTRGLIGFIIAAQRHGVYNHFDSYPRHLGVSIVEFILSLEPAEYALMAERVRNLTWVDGESPPSAELQERYEKAGFADTSIGNQKLSDWFCLLRRAEGKALLPAIKSGQLVHVVEDIEFLSDSFSCQWAYFVDFDNKKMEVWASGTFLGERTFEALIGEGAKWSMEEFGSD